MTIKPAVLDALVAAGCTAEQIAAAVKADVGQRSTNAERQARYRARKASQTVTRDVTRRNETLCNVTGSPPKECPQTPIEITPPPVSASGGVSSEPDGSSETVAVKNAGAGAQGDVNGKPHNQKLHGYAVYSKDEHFMELVRSVPWRRGSNDKPYKVWLRLSEDDRDLALLGAAAYATELVEKRRQRADYPEMMLATFMNGRQWESRLTDDIRRAFGLEPEQQGLFDGN